MTHSPTPWSINRFGNIVDANGTQVFEMGDKVFILEAVNAYEANQALIRQLVEALDDLETEVRIYHGIAREALEAARKAGFEP